MGSGWTCALPLLLGLPAGAVARLLAAWLTRGGAGGLPARPAWAAPAGLGVSAVALALLPPGLVWPGCVLGWLLLALVLADLGAMLLPDALTLALLLAGWAWVAAGVGPAAADALAGMALGFGVPWLVARAYRRLRGRDGLGLGGAKLLGAAGPWIGWQGLPTALAAGALATLAVLLLVRRLPVRRLPVRRLPMRRLPVRRRRCADAAVPFGPGLAAGIWLAFALQA